MEEPAKDKIIDDEHLRLLSLAYLIDGCFTVGLACLFIFHFVFMLSVAGNPDLFAAGVSPESATAPLEFFRVFAYIIGVFIVLGISYGIAKIYSARCIKQRKHRMFSYVVAMPGLLFLPYGTVLGIATFMVLGRDTVMAQYEAHSGS